MKSSWQIESGHLACRWSVGQQLQYSAPWMQEASEVQGSYLPPLPDFVSHSPFGEASWFERYTPDRDPE